MRDGEVEVREIVGSEKWRGLRNVYEKDGGFEEMGR